MTSSSQSQKNTYISKKVPPITTNRNILENVVLCTAWLFVVLWVVSSSDWVSLLCIYLVVLLPSFFCVRHK